MVHCNTSTPTLWLSKKDCLCAMPTPISTPFMNQQVAQCRLAAMAAAGLLHRALWLLAVALLVIYLFDVVVTMVRCAGNILSYCTSVA